MALAPGPAALDPWAVLSLLEPLQGGEPEWEAMVLPALPGLVPPGSVPTLAPAPSPAVPFVVSHRGDSVAAYHPLGRTPGGAEVLRILHRPGGTGVFTTLAAFGVVRSDHGTLSLVRCAEWPLGDRWNGDARLIDDVVRLSPGLP